MYPKSLLKLIEILQSLPGVGEKTAERFALYMTLKMSKESLTEFSSILIDVSRDIKKCKECYMITDQETCSICQNSERENILMVVSDAKDVISLEKMKNYKGYYHVLDGLINFSLGISEEDINVEGLRRRISKYNEMIIATNSTVEGELTAQYLKKVFEKLPIKITRLAYGLPAGTDFKYADSQTLLNAVLNRKKF
jgi:recombination protein RecR